MITFLSSKKIHFIIYESKCQTIEMNLEIHGEEGLTFTDIIECNENVGYK